MSKDMGFFLFGDWDRLGIYSSAWAFDAISIHGTLKAGHRGRL
jgi:hypothetical protein